MRSLTSGALSQIAEKLGNEPINIIEVQWTIGGAAVPYADRALGAIPGKILELAALDDVVNITGNGQSQEVSVTLDDTDGSLKAILDANDIHQRLVWVYQHFDGMSLTDKFLLFRGQISSPISYSEGERKLTFSVVSQLEDKEIGFSADDGKFAFVADELIGRAWPMDFGTVIQGKTLKLTEVYKGILAKSFGVPDFALPYRRDALNLIASFWFSAATAFGDAAEKHRQFAQFYAETRAAISDIPANKDRRAALLASSNAEEAIYQSHLQNSEQFQIQGNEYSIGAQSTAAVYNRQVAAMPSTITVVDGNKFPRGNIELKIAEVILKGHFIGSTDEFQIVQAIHPQARSFFASNVPIETGVVGIPISLASAGYSVGQTFYTLVTSGDGIGQVNANTVTVANLHFFVKSAGGPVSIGDTYITINQPPLVTSSGNGALDIHQLPGARIGSVSLPDTRTTTTEEDLPLAFFLFDSFPPQLLSQYSLQMFGDNAGYVFTEAGTVVQMHTPEGQTYIVSIVPGTVLTVQAFLSKNGVKKLVTVPAEYYTVVTKDYGVPFLSEVCEIVLTDALSKDTVGGEWGDDLYVTFESSVGPNTVDVLQYLIETYTNLAVDSGSFAAVHTALTNYPSHFQITDRKNILTALQEIAWQARCAIYLKNGVFFLRYLPATPDSVTDFTDADVDFGTMELSFTPTEEITTKMVCTWRATGAQPNDNTAIFRYNVKKYGIKEKNFNFYIYNKVDFVVKSATFWLIRYANTWKKIKFQTPLHKLNVESLDGVTLDFLRPWLATDPVIGIVENAKYDSSTQQLAFQIWTPVRAGEMVPYDFAYPAGIDVNLKFPTNADEALQFDGGNGPGHNVGDGESLGIPGNFATNYTNPDFFKMLNRLFNDRGQPNPSDLHDGSPGSPVVAIPPSLSYSKPGPVSPVTNNGTPHPQISARPVASAPAGVTEITFETKITDNTDPDNPKVTKLGDILEFNEDAGIHGAKLALLWDEANDVP